MVFHVDFACFSKTVLLLIVPRGILKLQIQLPVLALTSFFQSGILSCIITSHFSQRNSSLLLLVKLFTYQFHYSILILVKTWKLENLSLVCSSTIISPLCVYTFGPFTGSFTVEISKNTHPQMTPWLYLPSHCSAWYKCKIAFLCWCSPPHQIPECFHPWSTTLFLSPPSFHPCFNMRVMLYGIFTLLQSPNSERFLVSIRATDHSTDLYNRFGSLMSPITHDHNVRCAWCYHVHHSISMRCGVCCCTTISHPNALAHENLYIIRKYNASKQ
jgi:hypothetical protein